MGWDRNDSGNWGAPPPFWTPGFVLLMLALLAAVVLTCGLTGGW